MTTATKSKSATQAVEQELKVNELDPHPLNPRLDPEKGVDELAASIDDVGLIARVVVRPMPNGRYQILAGDRRWRAYTKAGRKTIPCVVRDCGDEEALVVMARENNDREPLNTIEQGRAFWNLVAPVEKGGLGLKTLDVAKRFGVSPATVLTLTGALDLPTGWREKIVADDLGFTQVKALVRYAEDRQVLGECERDYLQNPWAWRSAKDFSRSVETIRDKLRGEKPKRDTDKDKPVVAPASSKPKAGSPPTAELPSQGRAAPVQSAAIAPSGISGSSIDRRVTPPPLPLGRPPLAREDNDAEPAATRPSEDRFGDLRGHEFFAVLAPFAGDRRALESIAKLATCLAERVGRPGPAQW